MKYLHILLLLLCVAPAVLGSNGNEDKKHSDNKDTTRAVVLYGEQFLLSDIQDQSTQTLQNLHDSLKDDPGTSKAFLQQLSLFLKIPQMTKSEVIQVIDSLFECPAIPYPLINQINQYVAENPPLNYIPLDTFPQPAHHLYPVWNTKVANPYQVTQLPQNDTARDLCLTGTPQLQNYVHPVNGKLTSSFGPRFGRAHNGVDIDLQVWDKVVSAFPGMVRIASWQGSYGRLVVVRHFNGLETYYAHLHRFKVKPGDIVNAGDLIGLGGSSGRSTGSHLHWEIRFRGVPLNPQTFIDFDNKQLESDTLVLKPTRHGYAAFPSGTQFHQVKRGDFLYKIAKQYGTTINTLCKLNGIKRNKPLQVGEKLRVI